jgi:mono/diheme cytochrome c family protein
MSLFRFGKSRAIGGIAVIAMSSGLWLAGAALADGPPMPNPLAPNLSPMISQLPLQLQGVLKLGALPVPGVDITGAGLASGIHGNPVAGATKFAANCAVCHGEHGIGGVANPGSDDGTVPPLNPLDPGFIADANGDASILAHDIDVFVQHGSRPAGPNPVLSMPAWGDHVLVSQKDLADIEAYVMELNGTFWPDRCPGIRLELANPTPGSRVEPGHLIVQGTVVDTRAKQGSGIDHIDFFLDDRDAGGRFVGTTHPAMSSGPGGPSTFQATLSLPSTTGAHTLFAYAASVVSSQQAVLSVPVAIAQDPSKAFTTPPTDQGVNCTP